MKSILQWQEDILRWRDVSLILCELHDEFVNERPTASGLICGDHFSGGVISYFSIL